MNLLAALLGHLIKNDRKMFNNVLALDEHGRGNVIQMIMNDKLDQGMAEPFNQSTVGCEQCIRRRLPVPTCMTINTAYGPTMTPLSQGHFIVTFESYRPRIPAPVKEVLKYGGLRRK